MLVEPWTLLPPSWSITGASTGTPWYVPSAPLDLGSAGPQDGCEAMGCALSCNQLM